jgi:hypothetical protein
LLHNLLSSKLNPKADLEDLHWDISIPIIHSDLFSKLPIVILCLNGLFKLPRKRKLKDNLHFD